MKVIVTRQNNDGSFDNVGMNNRCLISHLKAQWAIHKWARCFACGRRVRLEYFIDERFYSDPYKVEFLG